MKTIKHCIASVLTALALLAPVGLLAQTIRTWDAGGVGGTDLTTAANWSGDTLPASTSTTAVTRHDAQWDGSVAGTLNLTYGATFGGTYGVGLVMTAGQTSSLTLNNSAATVQTFRIVNSTSTTVGGIQLASGAGALTIGAAGSANPIQLTLGAGAASLNYYFANNSASIATIEENVTVLKGGSSTASLIFNAGNWNVKGIVGTLSATAGGGALNVNSGTVTLSGNNTGDSAYNINGGTLSISAANNLGTGTGAVRLGQTTTHGVLKFTGTSDTTISRLMRIGNGATASDNGNSTIQNDGTGALTFDNATFNQAGTAAAARSLTLRGTNTGNNLISGAIVDNTGAAVSVVKQDVGTWNLTGENTFSGGLQVWEGVLEFDGNGSLGGQDIQTRVGRLSTSGTLRHTGASDTTVTGLMQVGFGTGGTGNATIESSGAGTLSFSNAAFNNAETAANAHRTLTLGGTNTGANTISGAIVNNNNTSAKVGLIKADAGKWVLSGANTYTEATTVNAGTLDLIARASGNATIASSSGITIKTNATVIIRSAGDAIGNSVDVTVEAGGTLNVQKNDTIGGLAGDGLVAINGGTFALTVNNGNETTTFGGVISGAGCQLAKNGTGTLSLTGVNTYSGNTTISAGTLALGVGGSIASTPLIAVAGGATFDVSAAGFTLAASQTLSNSASATGTLNGNLNASVGTNSVSFASGTPALTVTNGTLTLSASTVFKIDNTGAALAAGNYTIISKAAAGNVGAVAGTLPAVTVGGAGTVGGTTYLLKLVNNELVLVVNRAPVASDITMGAVSGVPATLKIIGGKYAPTDPDSDSLTVSAVNYTGGNGGGVSTDGTNVTYTSLNTYTGSDTFNYTVSDGNGGFATNTVTVTVVTNGAGFNLISGPAVNGGSVTITYAGIPGDSYALETTASLSLPITWTPVVTNIANSTNGHLSFTFSTGAGQGYYRTRYVPAP